MSLIKSAVGANGEFRLDLSTMPEFIKQGRPDLELQFVFSTPYSLSRQRVLVSTHSRVLDNVSTVFGRWSDESEITYEPVHVQKIENEDRDCKDFTEFMIFIYRNELTPVNLVPVFGYAMYFEVRLNDEKFKAALACHNMLRLLEKFPMKEADLPPRFQRYRVFILEKIAAEPLGVLSSTYFPFMKATTLEEVMGRLVGKITEGELLTALLGWAKFECDRQGIKTTSRNVMKVIPSTLVDYCRWNGVEVEDKLHRMMSKMVKRKGTEEPETPKRQSSDGESSSSTPPEKKDDIKINVILKTVSGRQTYLVSPNDKVLYLRYLVKTQEGAVIDENRFFFDGDMLDDDESLAHYNIRDGDTIYQYKYHQIASLLHP